MSKATHIRTAFAGLMPNNPTQAAEIERRIEICGTCPYSKYKSTVPNQQGQMVHQYKCTKCTCTLFKRIRTLEQTCPEGFWATDEDEE